MSGKYHACIKALSLALAVFSSTSLFPGMAVAQISVYVNAPGDNTGTDYSSITHTSLRTESFDNLVSTSLSAATIETSNLNTNVGEFILSSTSALAIINNHSYSDKDYAASQAAGNYAAIGAESHTSQAVTLNLPTQQSYFGFSWNAGDPNNQLYFFNNGVIVGYYNTGTVNTLLNHGTGTVTTLADGTYNTSAYYGQPGTGSNPSIQSNRYDSSEPFAFLNFVAAPGVTFNQVVFANSNSSGTGFEFDNPTIVAETLSALPQFVSAGTTITSGGSYVPITPPSYFTPAPFDDTPEPGALALLMGIGTVGLAVRNTRRRSNRTN